MSENHLNAIFGKEENFSEFIKNDKLDCIGNIIGKKLVKDKCVLEKKAEYGDHEGTLKVDLRVETVNGQYVIIENQYSNSDHDHFGKIFTYATMFWDEKKPVTDAVWIVEKVREEHYNAVKFINDLLQKKNVDFKIWLLVASLSKGDIGIRHPKENDFYRWGDKKTKAPQYKQELDQLMPRIMEMIHDTFPDWKTPTRAESTPHCIAITMDKKPYRINIPFRTKKNYIRVEACFDNNQKDYYKAEIENEWNNIKDRLLKEKNIDDEKYLIDYEILRTYGKIYGEFIANIENKNKWDDYINQVIHLLQIIIQIADSINGY